jgi:DNA-binding NarL/FixJ family response regulator
LLAEDHVEMAHRLRSLLSSDYDVDIAADGLALIAAVGTRVPDVIISDIMMPGISGLNAARKILATHPDSRIIFVSVRDEPAVIRKAFSAGALGYVVKSDAGEELANAVETVLVGGRFVSSAAQEALNRSGTPGVEHDR